MSKLYDAQTTLETSLVANVAALTAANVVVDRQKDLTSEVSKAMQQANGIAVVIEALSGDNPNTDMPGPRFVVSLALTCFFRPVISDQSTSTTADEIVEDIWEHVHNLTITSRNHMCEGEYKVTGFDIVPDEEYLIYVIDVETVIQYAGTT